MSADHRSFENKAGTDNSNADRISNAAGDIINYSVLFERVFQELAEIRTLIQGDGINGGLLGNIAVKSEIESIQNAISHTKREILNLQVKGLKGESSSRALDELDAVVRGTEVATETILSAAEIIEEAAGALLAKLNGADQATVVEIHKQAIRIFEACNFQDLTGQRIGKVVQVLHFIEDRVAAMMAIWGGEESFSSVDTGLSLKKEGDASLLNGPPLATDTDVVSQDDIDSLFA